MSCGVLTFMLCAVSSPYSLHIAMCISFAVSIYIAVALFFGVCLLISFSSEWVCCRLIILAFIDSYSFLSTAHSATISPLTANIAFCLVLSIIFALCRYDSVALWSNRSNGTIITCGILHSVMVFRW